MRLPYVKRRDLREAAHGHEENEHHKDEEHEAGVDELGNSSGVGDASIYGQYRFLNNSNEGMQAAVPFGVKTPTGFRFMGSDGRTGHFLTMAQCLHWGQCALQAGHQRFSGYKSG